MNTISISLFSINRYPISYFSNNFFISIIRNLFCYFFKIKNFFSGRNIYLLISVAVFTALMVLGTVILGPKIVDTAKDPENFREFSTRVQTPFTLSKVDPSGMVFFEMLYPSRAEISAWLKEKPMTRAEWGQIKDFFAAMNEVGFHHGDLYHNLFIKRGEDGRLKVTVMDFELSGNGSRDLPLLGKWEEFLLFWGGIEK